MQSACMLLLTAAIAMAQTPTDDQRILRPPVEAKEIQSLSRQLTFHDLKDDQLRKMIDAIKKDPKSPEAQMYLRLIPPEMVPQEVRNEFRELIKPNELPNGAAADVTPNERSRPDTKSNPFRDPDPEPNKTPNRSLPRHGFDPDRPREGRGPRSSPSGMLDPRLQKNPSVKNLIKIWEKNFGSIEKTPALKKALGELLNSSVMNTDAASTNPLTNEGLMSIFNPETEAGKELADWLDTAANGTSWNFSSLGLGDWNFKLPEVGGNTAQAVAASASYDAPSGSDVGNFVLVVLLIGLSGYLFYRFRFIRSAAIGEAALLLRPRLTPDQIQDRETLIRAFEEASVDRIGTTARTWNHAAIATALREILQLSNDEVNEAARLYELARYTPLDDELPAEAIEQARVWHTRLGQVHLSEVRPG
ncbi:hypothetical protein BH11PLA2_BH11PLA2_00990 [soil metagenome]